MQDRAPCVPGRRGHVLSQSTWTEVGKGFPVPEPSPRPCPQEVFGHFSALLSGLQMCLCLQAHDSAGFLLAPRTACLPPSLLAGVTVVWVRSSWLVWGRLPGSGMSGSRG